MAATHGDVHKIYRHIRFPEGTQSTRPYIFLNMVQSADGKAAIEGKASHLGTDVDRSVMRTLRSRAHAVMVGGGTIRAEKLSLSLDAADARPVPRAVILTNTGDVPLESNLIRDHRQEVLVFLPESVENCAQRRLGRLAETRRVSETKSGTIDVAKALAIMKSEYDIDILLCEGGPKLNRALIGANLADELFLTIAPVLVGANNTQAPRAFPQDRLGDTKPLRLISSQGAGDELFLRYSIESC